eukprot:16886-Heterococcus_DN1.PRE.1
MYASIHQHHGYDHVTDRNLNRAGRACCTCAQLLTVKTLLSPCSTVNISDSAAVQLKLLHTEALRSTWPSAVLVSACRQLALPAHPKTAALSLSASGHCHWPSAEVCADCASKPKNTKTMLCSFIYPLLLLKMQLTTEACCDMR